MPRLLFALLLGCALLWTPHAGANALYNAGFRTIGSWNSDPPMRLDLNVWYPSIRQEHELNYMPWIISGALNGRPAEGRFPVLVISHASPATRFSYHDLAEFFARHGFVVVAPNHTRDNMDNMEDMFTWQQLENRVTEIWQAIELVLREKELDAIIDRNRIGVAGFGTGGTAALLIGGALPDCQLWPAYCKQARRHDPYCSPSAANRINAICAALPLRASLAKPEIKAVAVIAPAYGMLFNPASFKYFYPPTLLVGAGRDAFNHVDQHCEPLARMLGKKALYLDLPQADAGALMAQCPSTLENDLPELCQSVTKQERDRIHSILADALFIFFSRYLLADSPPVIPQPPDLTPAPATEEQPEKKRHQGKSDLANPARNGKNTRR